MPSTRPPAAPALPTLAEILAKPREQRTPLETFIETYTSYCHNYPETFRQQLSAALEWYADNRLRLQFEQGLDKRREEVRAGFDCLPGGAYDSIEDEGSEP